MEGEVRQRRGGGKAEGAARGEQGGAASTAEARYDKLAPKRGTLRASSAFWDAVLVILPFRLLSALLNPVGDCDETFNYWEPTHYLAFGTGFQTWEYSPAYGLRSYSYILLHVGVVRLLQLLGVEAALGKAALFFGVRVAFVLCGTYCEAAFVEAVRQRVGERTARYLPWALALAPGMFSASSAFLPQTFTMCCLLRCFACFLLDRRFETVLWAAISGIVGWPFVAVLLAPVGLQLVFRFGAARLLADAVVAGALVAAPGIVIDYYYYQRFLFAPLNIALYNSSTKHGANLYGVEPWTYYATNLVLNFNIFAILALLAPALAYGALAWAWVRREAAPVGVGVYAWRIALPMLAWLGVMFSLPHKEERFLYVIYPLLAASGAFALSWLWERFLIFGGATPFARVLPRAFSAAVLLTFSLLSLSRIAAQVHNFSAPFSVYRALAVDLARPGASPSLTGDATRANVCLGKEWYRFPSRFFLPDADARGRAVHVQFLKSDFSGLLPKPFAPLPEGTRVVPSEMNDMNREEPSRYVPEAVCDYVVDLDLLHQREPHYFQQRDWEIVFEAPFLDSTNSPQLTRALFVPFISPGRNTYGRYQLLRRRRASPAPRAAP